mmetsp:Transcript_98974/g.307886  ORF Transcript_98974/g.307886 Transcript_98974/m.307886 type:complete len:204 (+) Transcript_98974:568-1179(+)
MQSGLAPSHRAPRPALPGPRRSCRSCRRRAGPRAAAASSQQTQAGHTTAPRRSAGQTPQRDHCAESWRSCLTAQPTSSLQSQSARSPDGSTHKRGQRARDQSLVPSQAQRPEHHLHPHLHVQTALQRKASGLPLLAHACCASTSWAHLEQAPQRRSCLWRPKLTIASRHPAVLAGLIFQAHVASHAMTHAHNEKRHAASYWGP